MKAERLVAKESAKTTINIVLIGALYLKINECLLVVINL